MKIGYIRISTKEQNPRRQEVIMEELGVDRVFLDKVSGKNTNREELQKMLEFMREGDTVIVESISRFARNTKDLLELVERLNNKGVQFVSQKETIDTSTMTGKFMLTVFAAVAELEREYICQRQREGIDIAIAEGRMTGRPRIDLVDFEQLYSDVKENKISASQAARLLNISRATWYRRLREYEDGMVIDFN